MQPSLQSVSEVLPTILPAQSLTSKEVRGQVQLIQEVMKSVMQEKEHYGVIPGCGNKPTLLKAGAEKLAHTFRFAPKYEEIAGCKEEDGLIVYKIRCDLIHIPTGNFVGSGLGACNSREKKYRERSVAASRATVEEKTIGKKEFRYGDNGSYEVYIVPQNPWDIQNTLYKMACKRALVAAVLNATAASDIFTQDIEDDPETFQRDSRPKPVQQTTQPSQPVQSGNSDVISDAQRKRLYAIYKGAGITDAQMQDYLFNNYKIEVSKDIKRSDYNAICEWASSGGKIKESDDVPFADFSFEGGDAR